MSEKPFLLSVKVLIYDESDRVLLLKRSMSSKGNPGKWDLPGGKVDSSEGFDQGLLREVREETGLTISLERVAGTAESVSPTTRVIYLIFEGRLESGHVHLSSEHDDYVWIDRQDLAAMDLADQFRSFAQSYSRTDRE